MVNFTNCWSLLCQTAYNSQALIRLRNCLLWQSQIANYVSEQIRMCCCFICSQEMAFVKVLYKKYPMVGSVVVQNISIP